MALGRASQAAAPAICRPPLVRSRGCRGSQEVVWPPPATIPRRSAMRSRRPLLSSISSICQIFDISAIFGNVAEPFLISPERRLALIPVSGRKRATPSHGRRCVTWFNGRSGRQRFQHEAETPKLWSPSGYRKCRPGGDGDPEIRKQALWEESPKRLNVERDRGASTQC